jgi:type IV pilus assembly protein PilN
VILINLLPHREAARKRRKDIFFVSLGLAALLGVLISGLIYGWYQAQIATQQGKNAFLDSQVKQLEIQIKDVATLQTEIAALKARQEAVEDLQSNRNTPVHLFNELVKQLPDGVYVNTVKQEGTSIALSGVAQSNERVSELLRNLANNSTWFTKPELVEIVASSVALSARDQRRVSNFSIKTQLRKPTDLQIAALAASAAASSAANTTTIPAPTTAPVSAAAAAAKKI